MKSKHFERKVEDEQVEGWKVKEDGDERVVLINGDERVVLIKPDYGSFGEHVLIALLTLWWTVGLGNVTWAAYRYFRSSDKKVVRDEQAASRQTQSS